MLCKSIMKAIVLKGDNLAWPYFLGISNAALGERIPEILCIASTDFSHLPFAGS